MPTKKGLPFVLLLPFFLAACGLLPRFFPIQDSWAPGETGPEVANGERIYFTGENTAGERIRYSGGPRFGGMMMGGYLTCATCHGPEGRGGTHFMHMQVMEAPDIRYIKLSGEAGEHADGDEHADAHGEYDLEDFRLAVVEGQHPDGELLSRDMPRWQLDDRDLQGLFTFLKAIP